MKPIRLTVNGKAVAANVEPRTHLADFLRETLNLTGTHLGCEHGVCGACTLLVDGVPVRSCITLAVACEGAAVTTIEGQDDDEIMRALRAAFSREHALQCGYCTPGMLASARDTVIRMPDASEHDIRVAMSGNLCRCTGYAGIVRAIQRVIAERKAQGLPPSENARTATGPAGSGHALHTTAQITSPATGETLIPSSRQKPGSSRNLDSLDSGVRRSDERAAADARKPQSTLQLSFSVNHARDAVWAFFERLGDVTTCLPGTSLISAPTGNHVEPRIRIKAGPIIAEFEGSADVVRDPSQHMGTIHGSALDKRSISTMRGEIRYVLHEEKNGAATRVDLTVGYTLTGPLAQFSRAAIAQDIAKRMTQAFAKNLQARLDRRDCGTGANNAIQAPAAELDASSLLFSALWNRIKTFVRRLVGRQ